MSVDDISVDDLSVDGISVDDLSVDDLSVRGMRGYKPRSPVSSQPGQCEDQGGSAHSRGPM